MPIKIYNPTKTQELEEKEFLDKLDSSNGNLDLPFSETRVEALNSIANTLMRSPEAAGAPQILALGFWLRKSAIKRVELDLLPVSETHYAVPRGLAFHLPPANVDTLFAYSWALSFLLSLIHI